jgi:uncharacterized protein (TIGR03067 family)
MSRIITCFAVLGLGAATVASPTSDPTKYEGTYTIVSGEIEHTPFSSEMSTWSTVTITDKTIVITDKDNKKVFACTFTLDNTSLPQVIAMTSTFPRRGQSATGIIELDGDTLRICYALPGGHMPTDFDSGDNQHSFVLQRIVQ